MGNDNDPLIGVRGTANRATQARALADPGVENPGKIKEFDEMRAAVETGFRAYHLQQSNADLIAEAHLLNTRLFKPDEDVGPLEKSAIAETLIKMHREMDKRIQEAAAQQMKWPPKLEGVTWDKDDQLVGIVEGISPFNMIDWWGGFILKKNNIKMRKRMTPKPQKIIFDEGEIIEAKISRESKKKTSSIKDAILRGIKVMRNFHPTSKKDLELKTIMLCMLSKILNAKTDDRYLTGDDIYRYQILKGQTRWKFPSPDISDLAHLRETIYGWHFKYKTDDGLVQGILNTAGFIKDAFAEIQRQMGHGVAASTGIVALHEWLVERHESGNSIYSYPCFSKHHYYSM